AYGAGLEPGADADLLGEAYLAAASHAFGGAEGEGRAVPGAFAGRVAGADLLVHAGDDPGRDLLEGSADLAFIGGFAAAARRLGASPDLVVLDTTDPARPRARPLAQALARIVHGRLDPRYIAGLLRHGPRGAAEMVETVDRLVGFAQTSGAVPGHLIERLHAGWLEDAAVCAFLAQHPDAAAALSRRFRDARDQGLWHPRRNTVGLVPEAAE
ncbi:MAG TPA: cobaltochelatase subunit CobN, partial [Xanthobacteraceae bacterium]|nr:cobaltochelatase subunit CobN [Xanthobacteraceae bacterium]